jgi:hypothetical protein
MKGSNMGGDLVESQNGNVLHTANKEEKAPAIINENALSGLQAIPVGSSIAGATRTEVGTIAKSQYLGHVNNAESNTAV